MIAVVIAEPDGAAVLDAVERLRNLGGTEGFLVEVRLDAMEAPEPEIVREIPFPVIATCRRACDGGFFEGDEACRLALLVRAAAAGAAYVDQETDVERTLTLPWETRRILSLHDLSGLPAGLEDAIAAAFADGADLVKAAVRVERIADILHLRRAAAAHTEAVVAIGLGAAGLVSRMVYEAMGSPWTYARFSAPAGPDEGATGLPALEDVLAFRRLGAAGGEGAPPRRLFGVLSDRAQESIGPRVFNAFFASRGIAAGYLPFTTMDLEGLPAFLDAFEIQGLSVTTPFKERVVAASGAETDEGAAAVGAANTLVRAPGGWCAMNTDVQGIGRPLDRRGIRPVEGGRLAWVVGAGGAGRAAAVALKRRGFEVCISSRTRRRAEEAARALGLALGPPREEARVIVQATPAGGPRDPQALPVPAACLGRGQVVMEMNYGREPTPLEALALSRGATVIDGGEIYAAQAAEQLKLFGGGGFGESLPELERLVRAELGR